MKTRKPYLPEGAAICRLRPNIILANVCDCGEPLPTTATHVYLRDKRGYWERIGMIRYWESKREWSYGGGRHWDKIWRLSPCAADALNCLIARVQDA